MTPTKRIAALEAEITRLRDLVRALTHPAAVTAARVEITFGKGTWALSITAPQMDEKELAEVVCGELAALFARAGIDFDAKEAEVQT